ncbi:MULTISPECIES: DUF2145 domain-containing protein [Piscinibacter]|uniref:DUF2145 domain-containing protein n=1 Tax=Piscinibacter TaxID=1114981 RepID=UPI001F0C7675|nr:MULTISPECIES: DUF2145 domain-containing protein [Piscinibacter]
MIRRAAAAPALAPALAFALALAAALPAQAGLPRLCDTRAGLSAAQQDRLLQVAGIARRELEASGARVALIARSGLDLARFDIRYSHAGLALAANPNAPWSVRQLYFDCDAARPQLYDQGIAGFLLGTDSPQRGYLSLLLLPREAGAALEAAALDNPRALRLLAAQYSANAYPFSLRYQNCNQWVAELMASAWGALPDGPDLRARAQAWLREAHYEPRRVEVGSRWLMFGLGFVPWIRVDDHPEEDRLAMALRISLPESLEAFVRARVPGTRHIEICHDGTRVVVRHDGAPIAAGCVEAAGDTLHALD